MRYLPRIRTHGLLAVLSVISSAALMLLAFSSASRAQSGTDVETPVEVQSVELRDVEGGSDLLVQVRESIEWTADFEPDGSLVLLLARSVPGPQALDLNPSTGLVSNVTVGFSVPDGIPTTRILVRGRQAFSHQIVRRQGGLSVELRASEELTRALPSTTTREISRDKPQPQSEPQSRQPKLEPQQPAPNGAGLRDELLRERARAARLERDLSSIRAELESSSRVHEQLQAQLDDTGRESEVYRQRVSALHADRLQLIEDLRVARELLARSPSGGVAAGSGEGRLAALEQQRDEARAEAENLRRQLAESRNDLSEVSAEAKRHADDLARARAEEGRLAQALDETRRQPAAGSESEIVDGLRAQLEQSRKSEADLRGRLARAPRILGVSSMAVSERADPCLSFRPEPKQSSPVLECLAPGTVVEVLSVRADWLRVRLPDRKEGWVGQSFLEALGAGEPTRTTAAQEDGSEDGPDGTQQAMTEAQATIAALQQANARLRVERERQTEALSGLETLQAELETSRDRVAALEATVATGSSSEEELRASLTAAEEQVATVTSEAEGLRQRVAELESSSGEQVAGLQAELDTSQARIADLEGAVATGSSSEEELRASLVAAEEQVTTATSEAEGLRQRAAELESSSNAQVTRLQAELDTSQARIAALEGTVAGGASSEAELRDSLAAAEEQVTTATSEAEGLRQRAAELESSSNAQVTRLQAELDTSQARIAALEGTVAGGASSEAELRDSLAAAEEQVATVTSEAEGLRQRVAELESSSGEQVAGLQAELDTSQARIAALEGAVATGSSSEEELRASLAAAEEQMATVTSEAEGLRQRVAELESSSNAQVTRLQAELDTSQARIAALEGTVAGGASSEAELRASLAAAEEQVAAATSEAEGLRQRLAELESSSSEQVAGLQAELDTSQARIAALEGAVATGSSSEAELRASLAAAEEQLAALRASAGALDDLRNQVGEQANVIGETEEQIEALRTELSAAQNALAGSRSDLLESESTGRERLLRLRKIAGAEGVLVKAEATPCLKLRSGPNSSSTPYDCVDPGTRLALLDIDGEWLEVAGSGDRRGWVASAYVESESRAQLRQVTGELESANERIAALEAAASAVTEATAVEIAGLQSELDAALQAGNSAEARVAVLDEMRGELEVERGRSSALSTERDALTRDLEAARLQIDELTRAQSEAAETAAGEIAALRADLKTAKEAGSAAEEESAMRARVQVELEEERRRLTQAASTQDELASELEAARQRIGELESGETDASSAAAKEIATLRAELDEALRAGSLAEAEASSLEQARDELAVGLEKAKTDLAAAADERQRLVEELEEGAVDQAPRQLEEAERARQQLQEELDVSRAREQDLASRLAAAEDERSRLNREREELASRQTDEAKLTSELEAARQRVAVLEREAQEVSSLRLEVEEAHDARAAAEASVENLRGEVSQLLARQELLSQAAASEDLEDEARRAQVRLAELEAALDANREQSDAQATAHGEELAASESRLAIALAERDQLRQEIAALEASPADFSAGSPTESAAVLEPVAGATTQPEIPEERAGAEAGEPSRPRVRSADLVELVSRWAQAWSNQDVDGYLASYSAQFKPASGLSRSRWQQQRRQRLTAPSFVEVEISSLDVRIDGPDKGSVTFDQSYRSDTFQDAVRKSLELVFEDGEWRILGEVAE